MPFPLIFGRMIGFGRRAEISGGQYLRTLGYRLLASPYRADGGEIDIVAEDGDCLVFVEVKARRRDAHPEDAVTRGKRRRLIRAAAAYRTQYRIRNQPYRFDILALVDAEQSDQRYRLIKDAFRASEY
jgi:putative endonuclease